MSHSRSTLLATALLVLLGASQLDAQIRRGRQAEGTRWAPPSVGVRGGYDQRANAEVLGAQLRVPVVRSGKIEVVPSADIVFLAGAKDYQYGLELAWVPGGTDGGLFVVGGAAFRDTPLGGGSALDRTTYFGYVVGGGVKAAVGPVELEVGIRWTFLNDTDYRPNMASIGINLPFWSVRSEERRR